MKIFCNYSLTISKMNSLHLPTQLGLLTLALLTSGCAVTNKPDAYWGYQGHHGPQYWGALMPEYATCAEGANQSPIDLTDVIEAELTPLSLAYIPGGFEVVNNGHTIQVNYQPGSNLSVSGHVFELKQFHFHSPSENLIDGHSFPLEAHFVHADKDGNLAVIAVLFEEGEENATVNSIWQAMPDDAGKTHNLLTMVSADSILPTNQDYYRFNGSLTTPPCSEGVLWLVMKQPLSVSKKQIKKFSAVMKQPNNRPIQPVNARAILK